MCHKSIPKTIFLPLSLTRHPDGSVDLLTTIMVGKAVSKRNGVHQTSLAYPMGRWIRDPNWIPGSHERCLHFASAYDVAAGRLNSYGSHRLLILPSTHLYGGGDETGFCWHDGAALPVLCLDCEGIQVFDPVSQPEFWQSVMNLPPGRPWRVAIPWLIREIPEPQRLWMVRKRVPADWVAAWAR